MLSPKSGEDLSPIRKHNTGQAPRYYPGRDGLQNEIACLDGARVCPPEDVVGITGYFDFYAVSADPGHEDHGRLMEWSGGHYDSE